MFVIGIANISYGQTYNRYEVDSIVSKQYKPSKTQFMVRGYGHTGFDSMNTNGKKESSYVGSAFAPIFEKRSVMISKRLISLLMSFKVPESIPFILKTFIQAISEESGVPN